jgi:hypothetical protein
MRRSVIVSSDTIQDICRIVNTTSDHILNSSKVRSLLYSDSLLDNMLHSVNSDYGKLAISFVYITDLIATVIGLLIYAGIVYGIYIFITSYMI